MNRAGGRATGAFPAAFVAALLFGVGLNPVNSTLISTALEPIARDLGIASGSTQILVVSLYLACTVAQPTAGKLSEVLGPRRVLLAGTVLVFLGGVLGGAGSSLVALVVSRVIIGIGTSTGYPAAMFLVRKRAVETGRPTPRGVLAALALVGLTLIAVGPPVGGLLVGALGWRATFFVNLPVAAITAALVLLAVPHDDAVARGNAREVLGQLDLPGIAWFTFAMVALLAFLLSIPRPSWPALVASLIVGAVFVRLERRAAHPFFDVRALASNRPLVLTFLRTMLAMLGSYVVLYALPQWLEAAHGCSADIAGLAVVPMGVISAVFSTWASNHGSVRQPFIAAGVGMIAGSAALACADAIGLVPAVLLATSAFGFTLGGSIAAGQLALYEQAGPERTGTAAGLLRTFTYFGSIGASVMASVVFQETVTDAGMGCIGLITACLGGAVAVMTALDRSLRA